MKRIDLYEKYISDILSEKDCVGLDARLVSNIDLSSDFMLFLMAVTEIIRETHQDNIEFEIAMKSLSVSHLKGIISR